MEDNTAILLTDTEVAELIKVSPAALRHWRIQGRGTKFLKLGNLGNRGHLVRYRRSDVEAFLEQLPQGGRDQPRVTNGATTQGADSAGLGDWDD